MSKQEKEIKRGNVHLLKPHNHRGIERVPGSILESLREDQIQRLEKHGVARRTTDKPLQESV